MLISATVRPKPKKNTVKPPNKGHFGDGPVVPCREVVLFSDVLFGNFLKMKNNP